MASPFTPTSSHAGGPAAGTYAPVGSQSGVTLDTTTYADPIRGGGAKLTTLVFGTEGVALAVAQAGDAFPRYLLSSDPVDGLYFSDGTFDALLGNAYFLLFEDILSVANLSTNPALGAIQVPQLAQVSPKFSTIAGALSTAALVSGTGTVVDVTRDVEAHTPVTFNPGAATTATCTVALSPDGVTYSTLVVVTFPVGVVFAGSIRDVCVRVPAGWFLKLTVNAQAVLGTTTFY